MASARSKSRASSGRGSGGASESFSRARDPVLRRAPLAIVVLALIWGLNWPLLKIGVTEMAPLTFRALTLPFAALCMFGYAWLRGESLLVPPG